MRKAFFLTKIISSYVLQITNLIIVLVLSAKDYGDLAIIISLAQFLFVISAGVTNGALLNIGTRRFLKNGSYHDIVLYRYVILMASYCVFLLIYYLLDDYISSHLDMGSILPYVFLLSITYILYEFASQLLYPSGAMFKQVCVDLLMALFLLGSVFFFVDDISSYIHAYFSVSMLGFVCTFIMYCKDGSDKSIKYEKTVATEVMTFSLWQVMSVISIYFLNYSSNYILMFNDFTSEEIGEVNLAMRLFFGLAAIFSLAMIVMPRLVHGEKSKFRENVSKYIFCFSLALCGVYLLISLFIRLGLELFEYEEYVGSAVYMTNLTVAFFCMAYTNLFNSFFSNTSFFKRAQLIIVIQSVGVVSFSMLLISDYRVDGVMFSYTISYIFSALVCFLIYYKNKDLILAEL
ncbi:hypothetical protein M5216_004208 [Vibrio vulnificus]|uniref:lipopolysaccharide biosynthesis protein n=1 Tax=Vibrio vulnificus TaxID=672 RepID=UPI001EE9CAA1|nr:hypothetical protein [Vibrio vulnificus]EHZ7120555.1 hypothetical protein [Vibrio vulnificus]EJE8737469.1 hypothetical protein [Vibrio vulnificus]EJL7832581.1 hypothetical protein [Vibrio vulnificus]EKO5190438.1 hypothetical protein [Vibrio vulnificus]MCG6275300.1 hypothetical protein [Vibrio vulnificus]